MRARYSQIALIVAGLILASVTASAQDRTSGAVKGVITDRTDGSAVVGATVVLTSPALQGTQSDFTTGDGSYFISNLPPGVYLLTVYYADAQFTLTNVLVQLGKTSQANLSIDPNAGKGEVIRIEGRAPVIDQGSTKTGETITSDYTENIPTGRTFGGVLGAAAGSQDDFYGVSFAGSTSVENIYIVEGINTTDPAFGRQTTNLPNEFIQETELITGGYNAEYGRSTGAVVNVITKSGSNQLSGSVFSYYTPGALEASRVPTAIAGSSIDRLDELRYRWDIGAEIGGPIIKDKLWFHVGINPSFEAFGVNRIIKTQVDRDGEDLDGDGRLDGDGSPDVNENGFTILEELDRQVLNRETSTYYYTAKITGAVNPNHQGSVSFFGNPRNRGSFVTVTGVERAGRRTIEEGAYDLSGKWTSKLFDNKTQIDAVAGFHRNVANQIPLQPDAKAILYARTFPLESFETFEREEFGAFPEACRDATEMSPDVDDPYPNITNCPVVNYNTGGHTFRSLRTTDRITGLLALTQRVQAAGRHKFKAGLDVEFQTYDNVSDFPGGERFIYSRATVPGFSDPQFVWQTDRYYSLRQSGEQMCVIGGTDYSCVFQNDGLPALTQTRNLGAYLQDSWEIRPNLTLNAGVRWEQQTMFVAEEIRGQISAGTGETIDDVAFQLNNMLAPRFGLIYDPTQEGRSKLFTHWGRFYESVPMDINARAFGGEVYNRNRYVIGDTGLSGPLGAYDGPGCTIDPGDVGASACRPDEADVSQFFGGGEEAVAPGIAGQYMDELVIGGEYEVLSDFKVGAAYIRRNLGRVIEDISTDGGTTYVIANPGEVDQEAIDELRAAGNDAEAKLFEDSLIFDRPIRVYNGLQVNAQKRFSRTLMVQGSYTLSQLSGNYPGLFSPETTQLDPNLTSLYDLPELMANRAGNLPADHTHQFKLDGFYALDANEIGRFVFGSSVRATSGIPHNTLGTHIFYGNREGFILPRGTAGRGPFTTQFDIHASYGRALPYGMFVEAFLDVFNLFNQQAGVSIDESYTTDAVNPIVGGDESDLEHLKIFGANQTPTLNPNYRNVTLRQDPLQMRFGLRLKF